jgi:hypothetical protein
MKQTRLGLLLFNHDKIKVHGLREAVWSNGKITVIKNICI